MAAKNKKNTSVFVTILITVLILGILSLLLLKYFFPKYLTLETEIFYYAFKFYPLLIGLILVQIASIISKKDNSLSNDTDKLPPNAYDSPLFDTPTDDPETKDSYKKENVFEQKAEEQFTEFDNIDDSDDLNQSEILEKINTLSQTIQTLQDRLPEKTELQKDTLEEESFVTSESNFAPDKEEDNTPSLVEKFETFNSTYDEDYKNRAYIELQSAKEMDYDVTLASTDSPIEQVKKVLGSAGDCFKVKNKVFFVYPFANEEETKEEFNNAGIDLSVSSNEKNREAKLEELFAPLYIN